MFLWPKPSVVARGTALFVACSAAQWALMSVMGQSRHFDDVDGMSALAPTATELVCGGGRRKGPGPVIDRAASPVTRGGQPRHQTR
jgi:hypothetical protein